jgi:hypothetical protein
MSSPSSTPRTRWRYYGIDPRDCVTIDDFAEPDYENVSPERSLALTALDPPHPTTAAAHTREAARHGEALRKPGRQSTTARASAR